MSDETTTTEEQVPPAGGSTAEASTVDTAESSDISSKIKSY